MAGIGARKVGTGAGPEISTMGVGGTSLGNLFKVSDEETAFEVVRSAIAGGVRFLDVAPVYGLSLAERRVGDALERLSFPEVVISTKVGYDLVAMEDGDEPSQVWLDTPRLKTRFDFSRDGALRSIEGSLRRLKVDRIDMVAIHDPDEAASFFTPLEQCPSHFAEAMDGAFVALSELRDQGVIRAIGVGMNQWQMLADFARAGDFDFFMLAARFTLLEQEAVHELLPLCETRGISLAVGGPYNAAILGTGAIEGATFNYLPPPPEILAQVGAIEDICRTHGISLKAAAIQFPLRYSAVATVVPGASTAGHMRANIAAMNEAIPEGFWADMEQAGLIGP